LQDIKTPSSSPAREDGRALLSGWLAQGLDGKRVVVIEPLPSAEITALVQKCFVSIHRRGISAPSRRW